MSAGYYLKRGEKVFGPHTLERVKELRDSGKLKPTDCIANNAKGPFVEFTKAEAKLFPTSKAAPQQAKPASTAVAEPVNPNLVKCEDCGSMISKKATACPSCGFPSAVGDGSMFANLELPKIDMAPPVPPTPQVKASSERAKKAKSTTQGLLPIYLGVGSVVLLLGLVGFFSISHVVSSIRNSAKKQDEASLATQEQVIPEQATIEEPAPIPKKLFEPMTLYSISEFAEPIDYQSFVKQFYHESLAEFGEKVAEISPDCKKLVYLPPFDGDKERQISQIDLESKTVTKLNTKRCFEFQPEDTFLFGFGAELEDGQVPSQLTLPTITSDLQLGGKKITADPALVQWNDDIVVAVCGRFHDFVIRVWDVDSGKVRGDFDGHEAAPDALRISPDGSTIATAEGAFISLWNSTTMVESKVLDAHSQRIRHLEFSQDGKYLASVALNLELILWDVQTGKPLFQSVFLTAFDQIQWATAITQRPRVTPNPYPYIKSIHFNPLNDSLLLLFGNVESSTHRKQFVMNTPNVLVDVQASIQAKRVVANDAPIPVTEYPTPILFFNSAGNGIVHITYSSKRVRGVSLLEPVIQCTQFRE
jgi:hypothetical protein